ncbi:MAG TPA: LysM peptidoglycan-binding domain-containing protein [Gemmatimonadaceae bacterium]
MRGRVHGGRQRINGGWWRTTAAAALLIPGVLAAQDRPAATAPAQASQERTHTVKKGDTLWDLAQAYLGDAFQWPEIYRLNRDVVEDPHWIYPGEVLRIPGAGAPAAEAEPEAAPAPSPEAQPARAEEPSQDRNAPTVFAQAPTAVSGMVLSDTQEAAPVVRAGEIQAAPWVGAEGSPIAAGRILDTRELPGIAMSGTKARFQVYEDLLATLPSDARGTAGERFLAVRQGPKLEDMGQVVIPTALVELVRPPRGGDAAVVRVLRLFEDLAPDHRLVRFDPAMMRAGTRLEPVTASTQLAGKVRWIASEPVLPTIGSYVVIDIPSSRGVNTGDRFEIYEPRRDIRPDAPMRPETAVALVQVVRTTPFGTTAVVLGNEQPAIKAGQRVRRVSSMR